MIDGVDESPRRVRNSGRSMATSSSQLPDRWIFPVAQRLARLARRNVYAITSFIFGLDHDSSGVADRTLV